MPGRRDPSRSRVPLAPCQPSAMRHVVARTCVLRRLQLAALLAGAVVAAADAFGVAPPTVSARRGGSQCSTKSRVRTQRTDSPTLTLQANALEDPVLLPPGGGSNVLVIGVSGGSGGGKSVFCTKLEKLMEKICPVIVISHDNYYKDKIDVDRECDGNWDCPTALHTDELVRDLVALKGGGEVNIPIYSFANNARVTDQSTVRQFAPGTRGVLLVEGLMVLHDEQLRSRMDIRVYVDCDEDTRFMRRLARDTHPLNGRGRTVADVYSAWARNVKPNHHKFVEPTKRYAHMIIPHHGLWADPGHLLAVSEDPSSLLDAYVNRVSLGDQALKEDEWQRSAPQDARVATALEQAFEMEKESNAARSKTLHTEAAEGEEQPASAGDGQQRSQIDEDQASMWPALYMLEAYVRLFSSLPVV